MSSSAEECVVVIVGVDIGAESTKVVLGPPNCEIVRNDVGDHTTPTVVGLGTKVPRELGTKSNSKNVVYHLNRLLQGELDDEEDWLRPFYPFLGTSSSSSAAANGDHEELPLAPLVYEGESTSFSISALLGMLLGKIKHNALATHARQQGGGTGDAATPSVALALSCPPDLSVQAQQQLIDAAYAAGIDSVQLVERSAAYLAAYSRKFPEHVDKYVMVVDMGHADTTVSILGPRTEEKQQEEATVEEDKKDDNDANTSDKANDEAKNDTVINKMKVLSCLRHKGLGAGVVDVRLWNHFQSTQLSDIVPNSRGGQRLLTGMNKLKQLLSQLPEGVVTVENVGRNDTDVSLEATRSLLVELCAKEVQALTTLVNDAVTKAGIAASQLYSVEVVGGGCRMPWVKEVLEKATQISTLSYTLDDTSAALGATLLLTEFQQNPESTTYILAGRTAEETPTDLQRTLRESEQTMAALDQQLLQRSAILNQMESHILGLRSAKHQAHGHLLSQDLFTYLDTMENWLFSVEAEEAGLEVLQTKWNEVQSQTKELSVEYTQAIEAERKAKEEEMEAEAKQAQIERQGEEDAAGGMDEEDHDNRRLPKKRRMEIVLKNKKEGGELFTDGNYSKCSSSKSSKRSIIDRCCRRHEMDMDT